MTRSSYTPTHLLRRFLSDTDDGLQKRVSSTVISISLNQMLTCSQCRVKEDLQMFSKVVV